jgi:hypothetical protein
MHVIVPMRQGISPTSLTARRAYRGCRGSACAETATKPTPTSLFNQGLQKREGRSDMGILWIILVVVVVLALLGFVGRSI